MKTIFTLFFVLTSYVITAQSYSITKTHDFAVNDTFADKIFVIESKPNSLFMFKSTYTENPVGDEPYMKYFLLESINGAAFEQIEIPTVEFIVSTGAISSWGIVFSAIVEDKGTELVFFDGFQSHIFDLVPDEPGSIPYCMVKNDRLFFSRFMDEVNTQVALFEFKSVNEIDQISNIEFGDFCEVKMINANTIIYSVIKIDGVDLNKAILNNNLWSSTQIWTNSNLVFLSDVVQIDNKLLFHQIEFGGGASSGTYRVLVVENNNVSTLFLETGDFIMDPFAAKIFKQDEVVYFQILSDGSLLSTTDGTSFSTVLHPVDGTLLRYFVKDEILYFLVSKEVSGVPHDHLLKSINNQIETVYSGNSMGYIDGKMDDFYLIEYDFESTNVPAVLKVSPDATVNHWLFNTTNEPWYYDPRFAHKNAAMYQGDLHFMFAELLPSSGVDTDIYALKETTSLSTLEASSFLMYPNPVQSGSSVIVTTEQFGDYRILNAQGAQMQSGKINTNNQLIELETLSSGIYFFSFNNSMRKFVVN